MGWTLSTAWSSGRRSEIQTFSGAGLPVAFGGANQNSTGIVRTEIDANRTLVTDQAGKQRRSVTNALGQLIRVDEPDTNGNLGSVSSPTQPTHYYYNTLGKMVRVNQGVQNRYFMHDSLGRLLRVRQPEQTVNTALNTSGNPDNNSWTIGFTYDNNGNLLTSRDANNVVITSTYDALNRQLTRSYSDSTPTVTYTYDDSQVAFSKGKLTKVSSSVSESRYTEFDIVGRLKQFQQYTDGQTYTSKYIYNLSGALIEEEYPSGRVVKNEFDQNGDLARIYGHATPTATERTYATGFSYFADGRIEKLKLGNGLWESAKINSRLQVTELALGYSVGNGGLMKLNYEYGELETNGTVDTTKNSGNIAKQSLTFNGLANPFVQTFKYDPLYRLTEAKETSNGNQTWRQNFGYDRYGNRTTHEKFIGTTQLTLDETVHPEIDNTTNRFVGGQGFTFDANGNLIVDAQGRQFTFNGDNKQTLVKDDQNNEIGKYFYDGEGRRIKNVIPLTGETTIFVYSAGKLIAEYSTEAPPQNPTTSYTVTDQLGSPRVIVDALGQVVSRRDFMPFGEEVDVDGTYRTTAQGYGQSDSVRQRFTGYQKDDETGLDFAEARMYQNLHGRFTAVDPLLASGKSADPQTFNRYVYVMNNPLMYTDPTGLQAGARMWVRTRSDGGRSFALARGRPQGKGWSRFTGSENVRSTDGSVQRVTGSSFTGVGWWNQSKPIPSQGLAGDSASSAADTRAQQLVGGAPAGLQQALHNTVAALPVAMCVALCAPAAAVLGPPLTFAAAVGAGVSAADAISGDSSGDSDPGDVPDIYVSRSRHPESAEHILDAQSAGYPSVLTLDRPGADARRAEALDGVPILCGCHRDEYPPAMFAEGGRGASVRHISPSDNQGAGSTIMHQSRPYPDGQRVRITVIPTLLRIGLW